jgi:penicillin-binding protein 2
VGTIQIVAFVLLSILGARLFYLQIVKGEYYSERAENQSPADSPAAIFDRNGKLLVDSRSTYNVVLSNEGLKTVNERAGRRHCVG